MVGPEEVVFDWTTDRCEDEHIPDIAARALRGADDSVSLYVSHYVTYRMVGPDLGSVASDCSRPVMTSAFDAEPSQFDDAEWLASTWTDDGETVWGVVHNEYRGVAHGDVRPDQCPSGDNLTCMDVTLTLAVSTDGGATFVDAAAPPDHLVASMPHTFDDEGVPSGLWQTSNIIRRDDGFFYLLVNVADYPDVVGDPPPQWVCAMRTDDLSDPRSWRYWDGDDYAGVFVDPYRDAVDPDETCAPVSLPVLGAELSHSIVFDSVLDRYVIVGSTRGGISYATSEDLINWTGRQELISLPGPGDVADDANDLFHAYPSLIDPDSSSRNFETSDGQLYLYVSRLNAGGNSLDRDLVRYPVAVQTVDFEIPDWTFDVDGDLEGWQPLWDLGPLEAADGALRMRSTGTDPYLASPAVRFPAAGYPTLRITMAVPEGGGDTGQVFFARDDATDFSGDRLLSFDLVTDGEMRTYELDMASAPGWEGIISRIRIDPGTRSDVDIAIERVEVGR